MPKKKIKICVKCGAEKIIDEFSRDRSMLDGCTSACKTCRKKSYKKWVTPEIERDKKRCCRAKKKYGFLPSELKITPKKNTREYVFVKNTRDLIPLGKKENEVYILMKDYYDATGLYLTAKKIQTLLNTTTSSVRDNIRRIEVKRWIINKKQYEAVKHIVCPKCGTIIGELK